MKVLSLFLLTFVLSASAQSSGFWMPTIYRVQERIGEVAIRIDEVEDEERHVEDMIDENIRDLKNAVTKREKFIIGRKISHLRSKMVIYHTKKLALLRALKKIVKTIPRKYRNVMIRRLRLEKRFKAVKEIAKEAKSLLKPKAKISHKTSTKAALKRIGHGLSKKINKK